MITPAYLKPGDKVGIIATARKVSFDEVSPAIKVFESWGLVVELGKYLFEVENQPIVLAQHYSEQNVDVLRGGENAQTSHGK